MTPLISFLVTCKNEGVQLQTLLELLYDYREDCECVVLDDYSDDSYTLMALENAKKEPFFRVEKHSLNNDYGSHKNYGKSLCSGKYIFQIDSDELPSVYLLQNIVEILKSNENIDLFYVPRINKFDGVTDEDAKRWGWNIDNEHKWVNWQSGDYQTRIFKNLPHIKWEKKLHERIIGHITYVVFPKSEEYALIHTKTMKKQTDTNLRYMKDFTESENRGI